MGVLAVYDTVGIQNFIFSSNKLAENVGASKLVGDLFLKTTDEMNNPTVKPRLQSLTEVIAKVTGEKIFNWREHKCDRLSGDYAAEMIYQGGGNAYVKFKDKDIFQKVTEKFLTQVNLFARGLGIAIAAVETDFDNTYQADIIKLNNRLAFAKGGFNIPTFAGNQPITKQSGRTGSPVSYYEDDDYLSLSQKLKRIRDDVYKKESGTKFMDFDDLVFDKGEDSLIAIIHVDGNNMGNHVRKFTENFKTYSDAVPKLRCMADKIEKCFESARVKTISAFSGLYLDYAAKEKKLKNNGYHDTPLLKLIGDGDDTTIVICGRFALDFTANFLREIENTRPNDWPFKEMPTACAGVIIFHSHFPFSEAYKLAEELCENAKKPSRKYDGSYIDFHLHQSGGIANLTTLRKRLYTVDEQSIHCRPWRVSAKHEGNFPNFKWFEENMSVIEKLPGNKVIEIRNAIGAGDTAAELAMNQLRGEKLPGFPFDPDKDPDIRRSKHAAHFDVLEMYGNYVNLLNKGDVGDDGQ